MSDYSVIYKGSGVFIALCVGLCILLPMFFLRRVNPNERKDFFSLMFLLVPLGTFCLWLLWVCMYISQINPMISPIRIIYKQGAETAKKVETVVNGATEV